MVYDPRTAQRIVKIAPGEDAKYWEECLADSYICVYAQPQQGRLPDAMLLYPGTTKLPTEQVLEIRNMGGNILGKVYAMSVHIPSLLQEMADNVPGAGSTMVFDRINQALFNLMEYHCPEINHKSLAQANIL